VRQLPIPPHWYAPQLIAIPAVQLPAPVQVGAGVRTPPLQLGAPQTVPVAYIRQAPAPSH
jgi:hypothetical protein